MHYSYRVLYGSTYILICVYVPLLLATYIPISSYDYVAFHGYCPIINN